MPCNYVVWALFVYYTPQTKASAQVTDAITNTTKAVAVDESTAKLWVMHSSHNPWYWIWGQITVAIFDWQRPRIDMP
jgi:hypothetical protein